MKQTTSAKIAQEFNVLTTELISMFERKSRTEVEVSMIGRLKKRIALLKTTLGDDAVLGAAAQPLIDFSEQILEPNVEERENFFMGLDVRDQYLRRQRAVDKADEFFFALVDSIRQHYKSSTSDERAEVYTKVTSMLRCAIEYKIARSE